MDYEYNNIFYIHKNFNIYFFQYITKHTNLCSSTIIYVVHRFVLVVTYKSLKFVSTNNLNNNLNFITMTNLIDFITVTNNIKGVSFASFKNYPNKYGEVANHKVNLGATLSSAKAKDLKAMQNTNANDLFEDFSFINSTIDFATFEKAFNELYNSLVKIGDKNLDGTIKVKSNRSYAQTNAYTIINDSVKVHKELNRLYIYGLRVSKEILEEGVYPTVKKQKKTICKDFIKKHLEMKHTKFVMYIVEGIDVMNLSKTSFNGIDLSITL